MMDTNTAIFFVLTFVTGVSTARILGISLTPSYSHQIVFQPIWKELSLRGHELVVLTTDPINNSSLTNLTEINLHSISYDIWNKDVNDAIKAHQQFVFKSIYLMSKSTFKVAEAQLQHKEVQALIKNETEHFDLVIVESLLPLYFAFAEHFKCPFIGVTTMDPPWFTFNFIGNPNHPVAVTDNQFYYDEKLTFFQRLQSVLGCFTSERVTSWLFEDEQQSILTKTFGYQMPHLHAIARNMSLLFLNTEPIFHQIRSLLPSVIQVGGNMHRGVVKPLSKDLKDILDNAVDGFVYFSLGSNVKSKDLCNEIKTTILETFAELPFRVLWKFELDEMPNKTDNVVIQKWVAQESVLRHPNIKLFITQGGLQSMEEAISSCVPMIGMPFFADQFYNVRTMERKGMGLSVDFNSLNKEDFKNKILEVIYNIKYKEKVTEIRKLIQDQPMTGLEKIVWWTEYVIRHKGARHLRSPFHDIPFYQFFLLDVVAFIILSFVLLLFLIRLFVKRLLFWIKSYKIKTE